MSNAVKRINLIFKDECNILRKHEKLGEGDAKDEMSKKALWKNYY